MTNEELKMQNMLFKVIERYYEYKKAAETNNSIVRLYAERLMDVSLWEMWALTQA